MLSQLSALEQRPTVRASIVAAALFLLAWSGLLFGAAGRMWRSTSCRAASFIN